MRFDLDDEPKVVHQLSFVKIDPQIIRWETYNFGAVTMDGNFLLAQSRKADFRLFSCVFLYSTALLNWIWDYYAAFDVFIVCFGQLVKIQILKDKWVRNNVQILAIWLESLVLYLEDEFYLHILLLIFILNITIDYQ